MKNKNVLTTGEMEVLAAMAKYNMKVSTVARELFMHRNTVEYRLLQIERKTGKNPKQFADLVELLGYFKITKGRLAEALRKTMTGLVGAAVSCRYAGQIAESIWREGGELHGGESE